MRLVQTALLLVALYLLVSAGCARRLRWDKNGVTEQEFLSDRYACLQESREQRAGGYANPYGAQYGSGVVVNMSVFQACMAARGYTRNDASGQYGPPPGGAVYGPMR
jgi:hypothetical protein